MPIRLELRDVPGKRAQREGCTIAWCDGPEDIYNAFKSGGFTGYEGGGWAGASAEEAFRKGTFGSMEYVPLVESMLDKVDAQLADVNAGALIMDNAVAGFMPDVPSAIMGLPESMITLEDTSNDRAPITIWVNTTMGANWDADAIAPRGAAITALLMKLQAVRPVRLVGVTCYGSDHATRGSNYVVYPIASTPLSLAQVSYIFCETGWTRQMYRMMDRREPFAGNGHWDGVFQSFRFKSEDPAFHRHMIALLGGDVEHDVYIPQLWNHNPIGDKPVEWVTEQIRHYLKDSAAEAL